MTEFSLSIEPDHPDPTRLDQLTRQLFRELRALGGMSVDRPETAAPDGAKSGVGGSIGELIVSGVLSAGTVTALAKVVIAWIRRTESRSVTVKRGDQEFTLTALSAKDQRTFITWLAEEQGAPPALDEGARER